MAIRKSFAGAVIRKPGAYSRSKVDLTGASELGGNETLFLIGEAQAGAPGDVSGIVEYRASQLGAFIEEFQSGPIVDAALAAVQPSKTPGINGASRILVWKTNSSLQASLDLENSSSTVLFNLKSRVWGSGGNDIKVKVEDGVAPASQKQITVTQETTVESLSQNTATAQVQIQYTGADASCTAAIAGATKNAKVLTLTTSSTPADDLTINLSDYSMSGLADFINNQANYTATLQNTQTGAILSATDLDPISAVDAKTAPTDLFRIQEEILEIINEESDLVEATLVPNVEGLPANIADTFLSGGVKGATAPSDITDGLDASLAEDYNIALPCFSRDATDDIADSLTDSGSTYDIESMIAALDSHLRLRGNIKNRKEAQGMIGFRSDTIQDVYDQCQTTNSELVQIFAQDVLRLDTDATLKWKFPHVQAALAAGTRLGTEVGEPLTFKFLNAEGVGHAADPDTGLEDGDFNPNTDFEVAIDAGMTFAEQSAGGFRFVVDNTTYGKDQSFVFNRGSVVEASQFVAKEIRSSAELIFVGQKVSNGIAQSIKTVIRAKLLELNAANIITASDDAPQGFVEETFVVTIDGNTANVAVEVKPVQGLDFIFIEFTLGDISQSA